VHNLGRFEKLLLGQMEHGRAELLRLRASPFDRVTHMAHECLGVQFLGHEVTLRAGLDRLGCEAHIVLTGQDDDWQRGKRPLQLTEMVQASAIAQAAAQQHDPGAAMPNPLQSITQSLRRFELECLVG